LFVNAVKVSKVCEDRARRADSLVLPSPIGSQPATAAESALPAANRSHMPQYQKRWPHGCPSPKSHRQPYVLLRLKGPLKGDEDEREPLKLADMPTPGYPSRTCAREHIAGRTARTKRARARRRLTAAVDQHDTGVKD